MTTSDAVGERIAVRTTGLTKRYGEKVAVDGLDLTVHLGEVFGLLGPNGAGKTTTILMLLGLSEPSDGSADVLGLNPTRNPLEVKARVGYLPDSVGFYDGMTGRENLRYTARLNGLAGDEGEERIASLLARVGLTDVADNRVETYSRGMRQRLGIADALVKDPAVLILDEPTVAIDPEGVAGMLDLIRGLADAGTAVLLSSHLLHQVEQICDRVAIFVDGRVVVQGIPSELSAPGDGRTVIEVGFAREPSDVEGLIGGVRGVTDVRHHPRDARLWLVTADRDVRGAIASAAVGAGEELRHLRRHGDELDEIYRRYFAEGRDERAA